MLGVCYLMKDWLEIPKKMSEKEKKNRKIVFSKRDMTHALSKKVSDIETTGNSIVCYFP